MLVVLIGGQYDGERLEVPDINNGHFRLPMKDGGKFDYEKYVIERLLGDGVHYNLARQNSLSVNEMLARLVAKYPTPERANQ